MTGFLPSHLHPGSEYLSKLNATRICQLPPNQRPGYFLQLVGTTHSKGDSGTLHYLPTSPKSLK